MGERKFGGSPLFSAEWVEKNPWMQEENEKAENEAKQTLTAVERFHAIPSCFVNFPQGIPIPKIRKEQKRIRDFMVEQEQRLAIFHEMLGEKSIRPGRNGVGEPYRGWGRSARK